MKDSLFVPRILWAALFASTLIYLLVLEVVELQTGSSWETLLYPFAFAAVSTAGASLMAPRMMLRSAGASDTSTVTHDGGYLTMLIVALALAESVAIFGLVLGFLGAPADSRRAVLRARLDPDDHSVSYEGQARPPKR